jgi:flagellar hook-basal body complex protein FliE
MAVPVASAAINAYLQAAKMGATPEAAGAGSLAAPGSSFTDMLSGILNDASNAGHTAEAKIGNAVQGKGDLVDVVTAIQAAETSLETVVAIRDKVIAAYQDIMRMPI